MLNPKEVLKRYWGYEDFRTPQLEIINSLLSKKDTLAVLPTGAGKSICYQVTALSNEGICIVISPLIALIQDQVNQLNNRNIKSLALIGSLSFEDTNRILDNAQNGNYKFIYLAPERLKKEWILERLKNLNVNLIAIDEAHCISQWGHDFRPSYLELNILKEHFTCPILAVTATATEDVKCDIIKTLKLNQPNIFNKSFYRNNLGYHILNTEIKFEKLIQILTKNPQPSIVYLKNRKETITLSNQLNQLGFKSTYYHGGLSFKDKKVNLDSWLTEKTPIIIATNAFGMGIDKPNVKTVIHYYIPENLENYYQEVGRAGRNGTLAYGILLTNSKEIDKYNVFFEHLLLDKSFIQLIYKHLNTFFRIPYGEGLEEEFQFNLIDFCQKFNLPTTKTYNTIKFLENQGILEYSNQDKEKANVQFLLSNREIIRFISLNPNTEDLIQFLVRTYTGIISQLTAINISYIANKLNSNEKTIIDQLEVMKQKNCIELELSHLDSSIVFYEPREDQYTINRIIKNLNSLNTKKLNEHQAINSFISNTTTCKAYLISNYFGESNSIECGICSTCVKNKNITNTLESLILELLKSHSLTAIEIENHLNTDKNSLKHSLQKLLETNKITINNELKYTLLPWKN